MRTTPRTPPPIAIAREVVEQHALFDLVLAAIEERCSSFALDDVDDQRAAAYAIADELQRRGVRP